MSYDVELYVLRNLCTDLILASVFQEQHESITIQIRRTETNINIYCAYSYKNYLPQSYLHISGRIVSLLEPNNENTQHVTEICYLTDVNITEPTNSSWRSQVLVVLEENVKTGVRLFRNN